MDAFESSLPFIDQHMTKGMSLDKDINEFDHDFIQNHYMEMLANDFAKGSDRAKKDRELRSKSRKLFQILSDLLHRVQSEHSIEIVDDSNDEDRPSDTNRCRDSDLRTLRKANKTLIELLEVSRDLKKKKREVKAMKKMRDMKARKGKKIRRVSSFCSQSSKDSIVSNETQTTADTYYTQDSQYSNMHTPYVIPQSPTPPPHEQSYQSYPSPTGSMYTPHYPSYPPSYYHQMQLNHTTLIRETVDLSAIHGLVPM